MMIGVIILCSCSSEKFIPENEYLLDKVVIKSDTKDVDAKQLAPHIRQRANSRWFSLLKIPLGTYAMSGSDTTKWINRALQNLGEKPVIFDSTLAKISCEQLKMAMQNMGYLHSEVDLKTEVKRKKLTAIYTLHPNTPFFIRNFRYDIQDSVIERLLHPNLYVNQAPRQFSVSSLDAERKRLTSILNDSGYYRFHKDFIMYTADTVAGSKDIDVTLHLLLYRPNNDAPETLHPRYRINNIRFLSSDSIPLPLRINVLENNTVLESGKYFSSKDLQRTYNNFGKLGIVRYTNITFTEGDPYENGDRNLDCDIQISTNKPNTISFQPEGTNTAGDLGAAASLKYQNRNLFRGSEQLSIQFRAAFEAITGLEGYDNHDYEEYGVETKLQFPRLVAPFLSRSFIRSRTATSELSLSWDMQNRPEFHRRVFSAGWNYRWNNPQKRTSYSFDLVDFDYVYMPWMSETFKNDYIDNVTNRNAILRYNYEDLFIMKTGFGIAYNDGSRALRAHLETAGNLLNAISRGMGFSKNTDGQYTLFNIAYAQYVKFDADFTKLFHLDNNNQMALHAGFGIALPYGNSRMLPFEKRYFSGGANSVRGWHVRGLGPGKFKGSDGRIDFINQTGDLKLDLNAEFRTHLFWKIYGALFVDAGNIWTLKEYSEQPGGQFVLSEFYKQIAASYGLGFRFNFDYFILRFDMGMKAVNPAYETSDEHFPIFHPRMSRDFMFHFAVGLPF